MHNIVKRTLQVSIKKIILVTDFTAASKDASCHAMLLAQTYKAELKALYVFKPRSFGISDENYLPQEQFISNEDPKKTRQRGEDTLKELAESFDLEVETIFVEGHAGEEIIRITTESNTDLDYSRSTKLYWVEPIYWHVWKCRRIPR